MRGQYARTAELWRHWFYWIPDQVVVHTDARYRRAVNFWLLVLWIVVGTPLWLYLAEKLWFVGWMSLYAIWATHLSAFSAETPFEEEYEIPNEQKLSEEEVTRLREEHEHRHDKEE